MNLLQEYPQRNLILIKLVRYEEERHLLRYQVFLTVMNPIGMEKSVFNWGTAEIAQLDYKKMGRCQLHPHIKANEALFSVPSHTFMVFPTR